MQCLPMANININSPSTSAQINMNHHSNEAKITEYKIFSDNEAMYYKTFENKNSIRGKIYRKTKRTRKYNSEEQIDFSYFPNTRKNLPNTEYNGTKANLTQNHTLSMSTGWAMLADTVKINHLKYAYITMILKPL